MQLDYLECFKVLSHNLSFSLTAKQMRISQSTVSKYIHALEEEIQTVLFLRNKHSVVLSPLGIKFKQEILPILEHMQTSLNEMKNTAVEPTGTIKFGCLQEIGEHIFNKYMDKFLQKYPKINFRMIYSNNDTILEQIISGELDFGVSGIMCNRENIKAFKFFQEELILITSLENTTPLDAQPTLNFVNYEEDDMIYEAYVEQNNQKLKSKHINIKCSINSFSSIIDLVSKTNYYAIITRHILDRFPEKKVRVVDTVKNKNQLYFLYQDRQFLTKKDAIFLEFMKEIIKIAKN